MEPDLPSDSLAAAPTRWAPRVSIVTDRQLTDGPGGLADRVARALQGTSTHADGPEGRDVLVHLREKDLPGRDLLGLARALRAVTRGVGARLFVNDRVDVALAAGADGVHLGGGALSPAEVRSIAPGLAVSVAAHSVAEVERVAADPAVTFAVLGPIFETPSKRRFGLPPLGLEALTAAATRGGGLPVVAIGGIDAGRALACFAAGASGVSCIRGILTADDPAGALRGLWLSRNGKR